MATLVVSTQARFIKKATGRTSFVCESGLEIREDIRRTMVSGEAVELVCPARGYDEQGELIAEISFTWSFKRRRRQG